MQVSRAETNIRPNRNQEPPQDRSIFPGWVYSPSTKPHTNTMNQEPAQPDDEEDSSHDDDREFLNPLAESRNALGVGSLFVSNYARAHNDFRGAVYALQEGEPNRRRMSRVAVAGEADAMDIRVTSSLIGESDAFVTDGDSVQQLLARARLDRGDHNTLLRMYDKVFTFEGRPNPDDEEADGMIPVNISTLACAAAVLAYNIGATFHLQALLFSNNRSNNLGLSALYYQTSLIIALRLHPQDVFRYCRLLILASCNNMAHVHLHLSSPYISQAYLSYLGPLLDQGEEDEEEDLHFEISVELADYLASRGAPMA